MTRRPRRGAARAIHRAALMSLFFWARRDGGPALAGSGRSADPLCGEDIEHNTNIFDLPKSGGAPVGKNGSTLPILFRHACRRRGHVSPRRAKVLRDGRIPPLQYDNFTALNHNEELFDGGLKWKLARTVDGLFEYPAMNSAVSSFRIWRRPPN